jgi:hypothetical protein
MLTDKKYTTSRGVETPWTQGVIDLARQELSTDGFDSLTEPGTFDIVLSVLALTHDKSDRDEIDAIPLRCARDPGEITFGTVRRSLISWAAFDRWEARCEDLYMSQEPWLDRLD